MTEKEESNLVNIAIGIIMIILNSVWLYYSSERFYCQNFGCGILYNFLIPNWILMINIICALIGIIFAAKLIRKRISAWTAIPINLGLFCCCILIECLVTQ
ncbi:hypothetical protein D0T84_13790 [Dysgonomonas sp. 521]|nr:hypothetical protein [Dysgonomonas sp. 521]